MTLPRTPRVRQRRLAGGALAGLGLAVAASSVVGLGSFDGSGSVPAARAEAAQRAVPLEDPAIVVVYSATDRDAQLFISTGTNVRMTKLELEDPQGRLVAAAVFPGPLGQADFRIDTPEPSLRRLKRLYPPGIYRWSGRTVDGRRLADSARLSYSLLRPPVITTPTPGGVLPSEGATVRWTRVAGAQTIHLEVEQATTSRLLAIDLDGGATSFTIPTGFLAPGRQYVLDVKAVGRNGNLTVADVAFRAG